MQKHEVRAHARRLGLPVADKPDSHEICFVASGDHAAFVERRAPDVRRPGVFADREGRVVGRHDGVHHYTVGQRKGLGLSAGVPLYVLAIDAGADTVVVGPRAALDRDRCIASKMNWLVDLAPATARRLGAQIRYRHRAAAASVTPLDGARAEVVFDEPQPAVTPGQAVVLYDGDVVAGGGWID